MADINSILAELDADPRLSKTLKSRLLSGIQMPVTTPELTAPSGFQVDGFTTQTPQGSIRYSAIDPIVPVSTDKRIQQALGAGNNLASVWEIPERIPDRVVQGQRFDKLADAAGVQTMVPTPTERTIVGGLKYRPGKLADIENASIIPTALIDPKTGIPIQGLSLEEQQQRVDQYGPDPYGALSFGADIPATMLDRQKFEDYQQVRNQGRAMRDQYQIPMDVVQSEGLTIPDNLMTGDFLGNPEISSPLPSTPANIVFPQTNFDGYNIPDKLTSNALSPVQKSIKSKSLSKEAVQWAVEQVGSKDATAVRNFLKENGFDLE